MPIMPRRALAGAALLFAALGLAAPAAAQTSDLVTESAFRVCADPAADPMSTREETGFENRLADLMAEELGLPVRYEWYPMATGFIRNTLRANKCDVVIGYAQGHEMVQNTNHYLTSTYVLIAPEDGDLAEVDQLSDPALRGKRIGIIAGSPPANHLAAYGLMGLARPYNLFVDRRYDSPAAEMLADLEAGEIDAAVLWGPLGGPLVKRDHPDLQATPLLKETLPPRLFYRITMGVRIGEKVWQRQLNSLIRRHQDEIDRILVEAGVPVLTDMGTDLKTLE